MVLRPQGRRMDEYGKGRPRNQIDKDEEKFFVTV